MMRTMKHHSVSFATLALIAAFFSIFFFYTKATSVISDVAFQNIIESGAQIVWTTSISSDSRVAYGTSPGGYTMFSDSRCDASGYVTSHCVNLMGLSPSTVYYYKVESRDSTSNNYMLGGFQFTSAVHTINDPTLPLAPSSLVAALDSNGMDVTLTWSDNSGSEDVFNVYNRPQGSGGWMFFGSAEMNATTMQYLGHPFGTYEYYIVACNPSGCSAPSNVATVTKSSTPDTTAPSVPGNFSVKVVSSSEVSLSWDGSTDNIGVTGYNVYRNSDFLTSVTEHSYSDKDLTPSTLYNYAVTAKDAAGNFSPKSTVISVTTYPDPGTSPTDTTPPVISEVGTKNIMGPGAQIVWTTDDPSDSRVVYGTTQGTFPFTSTWRCDAGGSVVAHCVNLSGLAANSVYYYQVISKNIFGYEGKSAEANFTSADGTKPPPTATTTEKTLMPAAVSIKAGASYCLHGFTVAGVSFSSDPSNSSYFSLIGGLLSSPQQFGDGSGNVLPYGTYTWKAIPKAGYSIEGEANGTFAIPALSSCSMSIGTTTGSVSIGKETASGTPRAYIALRQGTSYISPGQNVSGDAGINIGVSGAESVSVHIKRKDASEELLGNATRSSERLDLWKFLWNSRSVPDGEAVLFSRVTNEAGSYQGDGILVHVKNNIIVTAISPKPATTSETADKPTPPSPPVDVKAVAIPEVPSQPKSYQETEILLQQKYREAEESLRKQKGATASAVIKDEEKRQLVREVRTRFESLSDASDSVQIGTTTLSRSTEQDRIIEKVSRVIAERVEAAVSTDTDKDGITDYDEINIYGTNPNKADTEGDGIKDGDEILAGTDPLKKIIAPLPYEDPKQVAVSIKADRKVFSVDKVELATSTAALSQDTAPRVALSGTALPNSFVTLYIFSTPTIVTLKTDSDGKWTYTMDKEIEDGSHEVYVAMTESSGKIIAKSDSIPFVKTAQAVTLQPEFALAQDTSERPTGFFRKGTLTMSLAALFVVLGISFMAVSLVSKRRDSSEDQNV